MNPTIDKYKTNKEDGPTYEYPDGSKYWYLNGVLHRTDGPAIETDGYKGWFLNGVRHRTDGPAIEWADEDKEWYKSWYLNGTELSEDLHMKLTLGPVKKLPLYMGMGFDLFISERLQHESNRIYFRTHRYKSRGCKNSLGGLKYGEKCKRSLG